MEVGVEVDARDILDFSWLVGLSWLDNLSMWLDVGSGTG